MMIVFTTFTVLLSTIIIQTRGMGKFYTLTATLPRSDYGMAIGYWNGKFSIFGGEHEPDSLVEYDIATDNITYIDNNHHPFPYFGTGSPYTQIDHYLYAVEENGRKFYRFNLENRTYEYGWGYAGYFPKTVYKRACLVHTDDFLFLVGGGGSSTRYTNFQIFNRSSHQFLDPAGPNLNYGRSMSGCVIHPNTNRLYMFGGLGQCGSCSDNTIESIYVGSDTNIITQSWTLNSYTLLKETRGCVAIAFNNDIYVIGGYDYSDSGSYNNFWKYIQLFDTDTGIVSFAESNLETGVQSPAVIKVGQILYVIGGAYTVSGNSIINTRKFQYCDLLATRPPTYDPTQAPTDGPTQPTSVPTSAPSQPTSVPTVSTTIPTASPTESPTTAQPTTNEPTTAQPTTSNPTTNQPTTAQPTTNEPTTSQPTTNEPTTAEPTTIEPTTNQPSTKQPSTSQPTGTDPTTNEPTTSQPTTVDPTTTQPSTFQPTGTDPTTADPTTSQPSTSEPTTNDPTTNDPTTNTPTTNDPTTAQPTTNEPTTNTPTSVTPTTAVPTTNNPTTMSPTDTQRTTETVKTVDIVRETVETVGGNGRISGKISIIIGFIVLMWICY